VLQLCSTVQQLFSIVPTPFFNYQRGGSRNSAPPPSWISDSEQRESIVLQFFSIVPASFFSYQGGGLRTQDLAQPPPLPIANLGFRTTGINCAPIVLNCAENFPPVTGPMIKLHRRKGGWFSKFSLSASHSRFLDTITWGPILQNCTYFLFENRGLFLRNTKLISLEVQFCGIVLTFFLKIVAFSLEIRSWFLPKIVPSP